VFYSLSRVNGGMALLNGPARSSLKGVYRSPFSGRMTRDPYKAPSIGGARFQSKRSNQPSFSVAWFNPNFAVDCRPKSLLASKIVLSGLDAHSPKQKLDLLQFPASYRAQPGAGSSTVMNCDLAELCFEVEPSDSRSESCGGWLPVYMRTCD
jgi:hypothetical protein